MRESVEAPGAVYTIGHSTRPWESFVALLRRESVEQIVDVRAFAGSRKYPQYGGDAMREALAAEGIAYVHMPALGGRRRPSPGAPPTAWRSEGFRGYAEYMRTESFARAVDALLARAAERRTAIMCSEAVPWRCHRHLLADALLARGVPVRHILDAKVSPHTLTSFATVRDGSVEYAAEEPSS